MPGQLNSLQRTMLRWNDLHPYNAVHVVRVSEAMDLDRLQKVVRCGLERRGQTNLRLDAARGTYEYGGGATTDAVQILAVGEGGFPELVPEIEKQLNTGFATGGPFTPFRFFAAPGKIGFSLGLAYFHPIADAEAAALLLKDLTREYLGQAVADCTPELYPPVFDNLLRHRPGLLLRRLCAWPAMTARLRRCSRPPCRDAQDLSNRLTHLVIAAEQLRALRAAGKALGVTLNDLFLALLMEAVSGLAVGRDPQARRHLLAVGCIVNTRRELGVDSRRMFGLFLGSFTVIHDVPPGIELAALSADVGRETRGIKAGRDFLGMPLDLAITRLLLARATARGWRKFYLKNYPLWGGITNMNLNPLWPEDEGGAQVDYFRAVSTGPATPLVLSITTIGGHVNIGMSYRPAVYSAEEIARFKARFMDQIGRLEEKA